MSAHLHISSPAKSGITTTPPSPLLASPFKRKTMSVTQTYYLAHKARAKLSSEAARPDHNLRLLVGHANLLDSLMLELADAEREQESWFNQSVRGADASSTSKTAGKERHIQWADTVVEEPEADWQAEDADSDSESSDDDFDEEDEDVEMADAVALRRVSSNSAPARTDAEFFAHEDYDEEDDEEDYAQLKLVRSPSHSASPSSPPELIDHDSDSSEDESMPPSPPSDILPTFSEKQKEFYDSRQEDKQDELLFDESYYLPQRSPARLVSAISVY